MHIWNPTNGDIQLVNRTCINKKYTKTSLNMMPFETKIIVLKSHQ
ncbi:hypothetical protein FHX64_001119 [Microbacter margulisiae]|uniref:Uncharacterized protein n=1 Tax=Microbacter margulisiae TaxID=1350067 RepID=A0A7W5DQ36_9PORP|nr:hypothetical protein [Microbacter margulisiae]